MTRVWLFDSTQLALLLAAREERRIKQDGIPVEQARAETKAMTDFMVDAVVLQFDFSQLPVPAPKARV